MMNRSSQSALLASLVALPIVVEAATTAEMEQSIQVLQAQLSALQAELEQMKQQHLAMDHAAPASARSGAMADHWSERVAVSGAVDFDYADSEGGEGNFSLSTVELAVDTQLSDRVSSHLLLLHEDGGVDGDRLAVDELTFTLGGESDPARWTVGKFPAPFGAYETYMIDDPLTLDHGDTAGLRAVRVDTAVGGVDVALYAGSGDEEGGSENSDIAGIALGYSRDNLQLGLDWVNSVQASGDSGWALHGRYQAGAIGVIGEYLQIDDLSDRSVYNVELGYHFMLSGEEATVAFGRGRHEADSSADVTQTAGSLAVGIAPGTTAVFELRNDDDGVTDLDSATARIHYEF